MRLIIHLVFAITLLFPALSLAGAADVAGDWGMEQKDTWVELSIQDAGPAVIVRITGMEKRFGRWKWVESKTATGAKRGGVTEIPTKNGPAVLAIEPNTGDMIFPGLGTFKRHRAPTLKELKAEWKLVKSSTQPKGETIWHFLNEGGMAEVWRGYDDHGREIVRTARGQAQEQQAGQFLIDIQGPKRKPVETQLRLVGDSEKALVVLDGDGIRWFEEL